MNPFPAGGTEAAVVDGSLPSRIARASLWIGVSTVGAALSGLLRGKLLAVLVGPAGVGVVGQLSGIQQVASIIGALGLTAALVRVLAGRGAAGWGEEAAQLVGQTGATQLTLGLAIALGAVVAQEPLAAWALGEPSLGWALSLAALGLPAVLATQLLQNVAIAAGRLRRYVMATLVDAVLTTGLAIVAVVGFGLRGAVTYLLLGPLLSMIVAALAFGVVLPAGTVLELLRRTIRPDWATLRALLSFGVAIAITYVTRQGTVTIVRGLLFHEQGSFAVGLFQAAYALSTYYVTFFNQPLLSIAYPELSACADETASRRAYEPWFELTIATVPVLLLAYVVALPLVIPLLNSPQFAEAVPIAAWHAAGDFCFLIVALNRMRWFASGRTGHALRLELVMDFAFIAAAWAMIGRYGAVGVALAHLWAAGLAMVGSLLADGLRRGVRLLLRAAPPLAALVLSALAMGRGGKLAFVVPLAAMVVLTGLTLSQGPRVARWFAVVRRSR